MHAARRPDRPRVAPRPVGGPVTPARQGCDLRTARAVKARLQLLLAPVEGVCGVGLTRLADGYALCVDVRDADGARQVPACVDAVPVVVRVTGPIRAGRTRRRAGARPRSRVRDDRKDAGR